MAELSENAKVIAEKRYFQEGEDWEGCCKRVSTTIAQFETDKDKYSNEFYDIINNLLFLPGGRILRNAGRPRGSLFNCYVLGIGDSRKSIGKFYSDSLQLWGTGGGTGCNYSTMRPRGAEIKGVGGISSGPVSFLKASDAIAETIESGGSRRAAALGLLLVSHPDIEEFIDAKIIDKKLPHHNISVGITEAFLDAVEADADWDLIFAQQVYKTVSARKLWEKILNNNLKYAEPGLINWDNLRSNNSYYYAPPTCTNPCVTGETLVHVADGRSYIPIKQLAEEKRDVPVFSFNEKTKDIEVRMMRHPRITGYNKKILKITLDDGSSIRCTEDHKLYLKNLTLKEAKDLKVGDRLQHAVVKQLSYEATNLNFKVIKIEEDGYEDVYNGTVDENHNFYIKVNSRCEENGRDVSNCILSRNCGETVLSPGESCDLGSLVLPNFIFPSGKTNWKKMEEVIGLAVRFLDDVIDINRYELSDVASATHNSRRQGLGVMGLADYLFSKKVRYGSDKSLEELEKLFKFIRNCTYTNLVKLSSEKGAFPKFDPQLYSKAHFIRTLPPKLRLDIKKFGVRCVSGLALAPTGTISLIADTTSGIEPLFRKAYKRSDRVSERIYIHPFYEELIKGGQEIPEWFVDSNDLKPEDHLNVQVTLQPYIDNAISKTVNLPKSITVSEISDLLLETLRDLKGVTLYVDGSREGQILNSITSEEVVEFINSKKHSNDLSEKDVACAGGSCEL
jgi:ribonucleoside-diphosphate reductase alpha chain